MGMFDKAKAKAEELADKAQGAAAEHDLSGKVDKASEKTGELAHKLEAKADELAGKAQNAAADHKDQMSGAIDKAAKSADERTKGKYHDTITRTADKAQGIVDRIERRDEGSGGPGGASPETPGARSERDPDGRPNGTGSERPPGAEGQ
jgi:uncharacterized protein YjbJ (UPF0337 family)